MTPFPVADSCREALAPGSCFIWAWLAHLERPTATLIVAHCQGTTAHALVEYESRFYDHQTPAGVASPAELALFRRVHLEAMTPDAFVHFWAHRRFNRTCYDWPTRLPSR